MPGTRPGVAYSLTIRAGYDNIPGMLGKITSAIGEVKGDISAVDVVEVAHGKMVRDLTVNATNVDHGKRIIEAVEAVQGVKVVHVSDPTFLLHLGGKIEMRSKVPVQTRHDLSMAYTPGVGRVCMAIHERPEAVWSLTVKSHAIAVVSDGTAVLGLGDIGPAAAMPVMEGKCLLFKEFGGVDAWPICLDTKDPDEIVRIVKAIAPSFGGINLEDISAPRCFEIEDRLKAELDIPVFHDDQHGTAVVVLAGLVNALKIVKKNPKDLKVVVVGVGAAGMSCSKILMNFGVKNIIGFDRQGALSRDRDYGDNVAKKWFSEHTNPKNVKGSLRQSLKGADFFLGLAGPGLVTAEDVAQMNSDAIVFALANPTPEIFPEEIPANVRIMATGRSDYPNQINNALCFPGLFRGVLDARARTINDDMKLAAAMAIADTIPESQISEDFIVPSVFDRSVPRRIARDVARAAQESESARKVRRRDPSAYSPFAR
ncbi:MAG: NAD-dependent malic enzyme [SAR202 cluster bacterium]|nr:NAD-dependent malic enzyme [SAR202 cluster bacterium]